mmetsp:Transcript_60444/g.68921  ORF Transcript_60444/g.68921 Transcript_60444/m.68921 type:complete len:242 (-) Transcript_60444:82-807(-)
MDSGMKALIGRLAPLRESHQSSIRLTHEEPVLDFDFDSIRKAFGGNLKSKTFPLKISSKVPSMGPILPKIPVVSPIKLARSQKYIKKRSFNCKVVNNRSLQVISTRNRGALKFNLQDIVGGAGVSNKSTAQKPQPSHRIDKQFSNRTLMSGEVAELGAQRRPRRNTLTGVENEREFDFPIRSQKSDSIHFNATGSTLANTFDEQGHEFQRRASLSYSFFSTQGLSATCEEIDDDIDLNDRE